MPVFLLPLEQENPCRRPPYVVWILVAANIVVFAAAAALASDDILKQYGSTPSAPSIDTLFTSMFLHAGVLHLLGNMFFLYMFGDNVEDATGHVRFVIAYLLCGIGATALHSLMTHHPDIPLVGASGAVSGVMGMYLVLHPRAEFETHVVVLRWSVGRFKSSALVATSAWFAYQLLFALLSSWVGVAIFGIAFWGHVGGFVTGLLLAFVLGRVILTYAPDRTMRITRRRWTSDEP